ncbi:MAG: zinc-ribbon domain-containing protein [Anaerolineales bacterium]|nr:zinc-ribbon domain-containing protein [Anaerolineales bacterium]
MSLGAVFVGLAMMLVSTVVLADPYLRKKHGQPIQSMVPDDSLVPDKYAVLIPLRDLDFDFQLGKIAEEDYLSARVELMQDAAEAMKAHDRRDQAMDPKIEVLVRRLRALSSDAMTCRNCGSQLKSGDRFCSSCGLELA